MKTKPFNINCHVRVRLTDHGKHLLRVKHIRLVCSIVEHTGSHPVHEYREPEEDADGYSRWQLWDLMNRLGSECYNGANPPFETEILIETEQP